MKVIVYSTCVALSLGGLAGNEAAAALNKVPACKSWSIRLPEASGPALVAEIPRAMTPVPLNALQVIDPDIARKLVVQSVDARRTEMNTVQVSARILNCTDKPLHILARTQFMDGTQVSTEPASAWRLLIVEPHGFTVYDERSIGTTSTAAFLIEARGAR
jgi:hypothetical protein